MGARIRPGRRGVSALALTLAALSGVSCAGGTAATKSKESTTASATAASAISHKARHVVHTIPLNNPAQKADPNTHVSCTEAAMGHACQTGTAAPSDPNQSPQRNCDTNIVANSATSCGLAENTFYEYYESAQSSGQSIEVHSPTTAKDYELFCEREQDLIGCTGSPLSTGIYVSFPIEAITAYTSAEADAYAGSRDVGHPGLPAATHTESSEPSDEREPGAEPDQEESPDERPEDESFCDTHECVGEYESEPGTVVECADGSYSHAGGISGACSHHGGER
jgi:hypothetical protein